MTTRRFLKSATDFAEREASSGLVLMGSAILAVILANTPGRDAFVGFWREELAGTPLVDWINEGLMAIFFLLVGLEIKRELLVGALARGRSAMAPVVAALGGMIVPAAIFAIFNLGGPTERGWGIPMATDIAFALGVLVLLGPRIPAELKVLLAAIAIVDDLGAVLIIALFYSHGFSLPALVYAGVFLVALILANRLGVRNLAVYALLGIGLWWAMRQSGIHATVSGVILAAAIPSGVTLDRLERRIEPWVLFLIVPIFALANAGVPLDGLGGLGRDAVALGVVLGLVVGKPIGILAFSWLAFRAKIAAMPEGVTWRRLIGIGVLAGIGFTMSLFVTDLAFASSRHATTAKTAILIASVIAGVLGYLILVTDRSGAPSASAESR